MTDPILIEVTRGTLVESWHRGAIAVAAPSGALALRLGDVERPVYPRSAVKALQALPLIETGAADRFGFGAAEIALACGSHAGTERHTHLAAAMLDRAGLDAGRARLWRACAARRLRCQRADRRRRDADAAAQQLLR